MRKWKLVIGVLLIFSLGTLVGSFLTTVYIKNKHPLFKRDPVIRTKYIMEKLAGKLSLSDQQTPKITEIVRSIESQASELFSQHRQEMKALFEKGMTEMKQELTPDQIQKLEKMREEYRKRKEKQQ